MFEGAEELTDQNKVQTFRNALDKVRGIRIIIHCCQCGKAIDTFWDADGDLNGEWVGMESLFSELFQKCLTVMNQAKCFNCVTKKEWKEITNENSN